MNSYQQYGGRDPNQLSSNHWVHETSNQERFYDFNELDLFGDNSTDQDFTTQFDNMPIELDDQFYFSIGKEEEDSSAGLDVPSSPAVAYTNTNHNFSININTIKPRQIKKNKEKIQLSPSVQEFKEKFYLLITDIPKKKVDKRLMKYYHQLIMEYFNKKNKESDKKIIPCLRIQYRSFDRYFLNQYPRQEEILETALELKNLGIINYARDAMRF